MKYAINVPNFGDYHSAETISTLAVEAEDAGWDAFFSWDHLQWEGQIGDPWVTLTAIACKTDRIKLGPMVTPLPRRRPWKVAVEALSLDHLSKGRLILGVGLGAPPEEYSNFGENPSPILRAHKLDEALDIVTSLWTGETLTFKGRHYQLENVTLGKPYHSPIPIWVAGFLPARKPLRRAARYQGVYPGRNWPEVLTTDGLKTVVDYISRHRESMLGYDVVAGGETPMDPEKGQETVTPWIQAGATWWSENINGWRGSLTEMRERIKAGPPRA
jgi:alkanesulfonate monooxygenase SsuD/methylene tetrahydromethanopterin reductase-like flavin-dependent oxidoreductase (luciferase family)